MINLNLFVGYQIKSELHKKQDYIKMIAELNKLLNKSSPKINLKVEYGEFPPGSQFWDEIKIAIQKSDVAIFDISENNPNVLLEAGISIGSNKHIIFLKNISIDIEYPLPSDLNPFIYLEYSNSMELKSPKTIKKLYAAIILFLKEKHDVMFYHRSLWSFDPHSKTIIIPGNIPEEKTGNNFEDYIRLRKFSDLDSLFLVFETLHYLYPLMEISVQQASELNDLPKNYQDCNLVLIGGPDYNPIVKEFDSKCPIVYRYSRETDDIWLKHKKKKKDYHPKFYKYNGKDMAIDYGFFYKRALYKGSSSKLVMLGGARTWGVCGAAMLLSCVSLNKNSSNHIIAKKLVERFGTNPSFLIPIRINGSKDGIHPPTCDINHIEKI